MCNEITSTFSRCLGLSFAPSCLKNTKRTWQRKRMLQGGVWVHRAIAFRLLGAKKTATTLRIHWGISAAVPWYEFLNITLSPCWILPLTKQPGGRLLNDRIKEFRVRSNCQKGGTVWNKVNSHLLWRKDLKGYLVLVHNWLGMTSLSFEYL